MFGRDEVVTVTATNGHGQDQQIEVQYTDTKVIGHGSFGVVYRAQIVSTRELVAIKKVLQDKRFRNRELQIMRMLEHPNVVNLRYFFYSTGDKLYIYQLFRGIAFIHSKGVCHRDIKPQVFELSFKLVFLFRNILVNTESAVLKVCDFGSAKLLVKGESNVSYICSRYYRAPELIFGATSYTNSIDVWSCGCIFAELMLGKPIFQGENGVDQLVEIIKVLGTPTREQILQMNPEYSQNKLQEVKAQPWTKIFRTTIPQEAHDLISRLLVYIPSSRQTPLQACAHAFFDELRKINCRLPNGQELPPLFNFSKNELKIEPQLNHILVPRHHMGAVQEKQPNSPDTEA